jgi:2-polyprenyl-3-methyl-5-hydroxy-6-metoxy-1,4-benzoquinol methylase
MLSIQTLARDPGRDLVGRQNAPGVGSIVKRSQRNSLAPVRRAGMGMRAGVNRRAPRLGTPHTRARGAPSGVVCETPPPRPSSRRLLRLPGPSRHVGCYETLQTALLAARQFLRKLIRYIFAQNVGATLQSRVSEGIKVLFMKTKSAALPQRGKTASTCLLCGGEGDEVDRIDVRRLVEKWKAMLGINIRRELEDVDAITEHRCRRCGLVYFLPLAAGSENLYRQLQELPWYYTDGKWEHLVALRDIPTNAAVLEVGCGFGGFLDLVRDTRHANVKGIDLSRAAIEVAQSRRRPVAVEDVIDLAAREPESYDVVCSFQVLEHVTNPRRFLEACVSLLKPGGRLCIGVPNNDGYLGQQRLDKALLNQPPHHMTRWGIQTLTSLGGFLPVKVRRIDCEPLEEQHVPEYITTRLDSVDRMLSRRLKRSASGLLMSVALTKLGLRRFLRGHTVYASYTRLPLIGPRVAATGLVSAELLGGLFFFG